VSNKKTPSVTEKLTLLRKALGLTQHDIAAFLLTRQARISHIERHGEDFFEEEIERLKAKYDIVGMPLTGDECEVFKGRLYIWRDLIRSGDINKAKEMQLELHKVVNLDPCDSDLPMLYRLFEVLLLVVGGDKTYVPDEKMLHLGKLYNEMPEEHRYHYDFHMGTLHAFKRDFETALEFYTKALETAKSYRGVFPDEEERVYHNLAVCYTEIEQPNRALIFLSEIPKTNFTNRATPSSLGVDLMRAINYYKVGIYDEALKILNDCFMRANTNNNDFYTGLSLHHLGVLHKFLGEWDKAIEYFNKELNIFDENVHYHTWALYYKIRCIIGMRKFVEAEKELTRIKPSTNAINEYSILFEALNHIMRLHKNNSHYNKKAVEYLKNTAIPFFIKTNKRFEALDCYEILERHEDKSGTDKRALEINRSIREILKRTV